MAILKAVRGTRDLLPPETALWNHVEATARAVFARYGFGEIRTPIFETTELFARGVGEETDIVSKEMYTWEDRGRAESEKAPVPHPPPRKHRRRSPRLHRAQTRRHRPCCRSSSTSARSSAASAPSAAATASSGRSAPRSSAPPGPAPTAPSATPKSSRCSPPSSTSSASQDWRLALNSVGSAADRARYIAALREALAPVKHQMCDDNQRRAETNPLRVLDSKDPNDQEIINALPKIADYLDEDSRSHFAQVKAALDACGVPYTVEPRLVRGLDYYTRTTFEFTVPDGSGLGTQNALLGGGRYDGLSEMLGGPKAPGIGFAIGEDRLILTLQAQAAPKPPPTRKLDAFIAPMGIAQNAAALALAKELRRAGLSVEVGDGTFRLRKSFETADKLARHIVIVGEDEVTSGILTVKNFATGEQTKIPRSELSSALKR